MTLKSLFIAALSAAALAGSAQAATVVDTGAPNDRSPWTLSTQQWLGGQFSLEADATITGILGFISATDGETLTFAIHRDEGSDAPGAELYARAFTADGDLGFQGLSDLSWWLAAGSYYVTAEVRPGQNFSGAMPGFSHHALAHEVFSQGGQWRTADGLGLGWRILDDAAAAPEPGAWVLMVGGLGAAGATLRRRRSALPA